MKLIAQVKLLPTHEQTQMLKQTVEQANALCNAMSDFAWENKVFGAFKLQKMSYKQMRGPFGSDRSNGHPLLQQSCGCL